jgi:hypothetical protein
MRAMTLANRKENKFGMTTKSLFMIALFGATGLVAFSQTETRPRIRDLGVEVGILSPGPLNAITDVAGVKVGQTTLVRGDSIRTVLPPFCRTEETCLEKEFLGQFSSALLLENWLGPRR